MLLCLLLWGGTARAEGVSESALRTAFLYYFLMYTEWPELPDSYRICLLGRPVFEPALQSLRNKEIAGRPIGLMHVGPEEAASAGCHLLYATPEAARHLKDVAASLHGQPVLTVTEADSAAAGDAMLRISNVNGILGFQADADAARNAGLRFSAKLMRLARKTD